MNPDTIAPRQQHIIRCVQQHPGSRSAELVKYLHEEKLRGFASNEVALSCVQFAKQGIIHVDYPVKGDRNNNCRYYPVPEGNNAAE